jgi:Recombination directionality factor-like
VKGGGRVIDQFAGWFRFGRLVDNRPQALSSWRVTTRTQESAAAVARLFGGSPQHWQTTSADHFEVLTDASNVRITLEGPHCITSDMRKWGHKGLVHHCDGQQFLSPHEMKGEPCGCPESAKDRKSWARSRLGPQPNTEILFRIDKMPDLGDFRMHSISWKFAESVASALALMNSAQSKLICGLSLTVAEFDVMAGHRTKYRQPLLLPDEVGEAT